jgi:hypothetical protein
MEQYADHPMDLADASLIAAAESLETRKVFTLDENDFGAYRIRRGHRHYAVEIIRLVQRQARLALAWVPLEDMSIREFKRATR